MKKSLKIALIVIIILVILYFLVGFICMKVAEHNRVKDLDLDGSMITVTEDNYLNYLEELYINSDKYIGKEILIEGFYDYIDNEGERYHFVGRELEMEDEHDHDHEDEHEHEHTIGLEFLCNDELPEPGTFIQVKGIYGTVKDGDEEFLLLKDCTVRTDIEKGSKTVK